MVSTQGLKKIATQHFDWQLWVLAFILAGMGVIAITAATYTYSENAVVVDDFLSRVTSSYYGKRQGIFLLLSILVIGVVQWFDYRLVRRMSWILYLIALAILGMVLVIGSTTSGVKGWFNLFSGLMLQPSEFAKLASIVLLSRFFSRKEDPVSGFRELVVMLAIMGVPVLLILAQGELGTAMVFIFIYLVMMFFSGMRLRYIGVILLAGIIVAVLAVLYFRMSGSYRYDRLLAFFDPSKATADSLLQSTNSRIAVGNGGLLGVGLYTNGSYTALNYVPQDHTDFIFASIAETTGFIGCTAVLGLFVVFLLRMVRLAMYTADRYGRLVIIGICGMFFFHVIYNIGMTIGITPVMGIPLPFFSYGGSNLFANMMGVGLILSITMKKPMTVERQEPEIPQPAGYRSSGRKRIRILEWIRQKASRF